MFRSRSPAREPHSRANANRKTQDREERKGDVHKVAKTQRVTTGARNLGEIGRLESQELMATPIGAQSVPGRTPPSLNGEREMLFRSARMRWDELHGAPMHPWTQSELLLSRLSISGFDHSRPNLAAARDNLTIDFPDLLTPGHACCKKTAVRCIKQTSSRKSPPDPGGVFPFDNMR